MLTRSKLALRLGGVGLGLLGWFGYRLLAEYPAAAETVAGSGPIPALMRGLSRASSLIPVPVAELIILAFVGRQIVGVWGELRAGGWRERPGRPWGLIGRGGLRFAQDVGVLVFLFYALWGVQYARPGLEAHLGIAREGEVPVAELRDLAAEAVAAVNRAYLEIHGGDEDAGSPTARGPSSGLTRGLETGWERAQLDFGLDPSVTLDRGTPKGFLSTPLVKRLGISGMYFPYTGEALVLGDLPGILQAKDMGHEMAHQRGFAHETDANTLGALVAARSPDPRARYSGYSFMERQLVAALARVSRREARSVAAARLPGVVRDLEDLSTYWRPARTPVAAAASRVNDAMLRSHGIPEGVLAYQGSTWVFVALARELSPEVLFGEL